MTDLAFVVISSLLSKDLPFFPSSKPPLASQFLPVLAEIFVFLEVFAIGSMDCTGS